jgi:hypothetical protein
MIFLTNNMSKYFILFFYFLYLYIFYSIYINKIFILLCQ